MAICPSGDRVGDTRHRVGHNIAMLRFARCVIVLLLVGAGGVVAKPGHPPDAADRAEAAMAKRFESLDLEDALIDQAARIAAATAALPAHPTGNENVVLAIGGQGYQAIFDREARRAAAVLTRRIGGPALVMSNTPEQVKTGLLAAPRTVALTLAALGRRARPGDTIIVYLTSHGGPDAAIAMDAPYLQFSALRAGDLAKALDAAGFRRRIIIVSACFAGSWIKPLTGPATIVVAAAAADRTSFGCDDSREFTLFGESLLGELAKPGRSLAAGFAAAKARIAAQERVGHITPSRPLAFVGADMQTVWNGH